jgi:hypothetical protein
MALRVNALEHELLGRFERWQWPASIADMHDDLEPQWCMVAVEGLVALGCLAEKGFDECGRKRYSVTAIGREALKQPPAVSRQALGRPKRKADPRW